VQKLQNIANQNKGKSLKIKEQSIRMEDLGLWILTKWRTKLETNIGSFWGWSFNDKNLRTVDWCLYSASDSLISLLCHPLFATELYKIKSTGYMESLFEIKNNNHTTASSISIGIWSPYSCILKTNFLDASLFNHSTLLPCWNHDDKV